MATVLYRLGRWTTGHRWLVVIAWVLIAIALIGLVFEPLHFLYDYAWFVGFFTAGIVYVTLMKVVAPAAFPERAEEVA